MRFWVGVEQRLDVGQDANTAGAAIGLAFDLDGSRSRLVAEVLKRRTQISDCQLKLPVIGATVLKFVRHRRLCIAQGVLVIHRPAAQATTQVGQFTVVCMCLNFSTRSSFLRRRSSTKMQRASVAGGSFRPTMPIAFGANVGNSSGTLSSPIQRSTPCLRVWPLLITSAARP